MKAKRVQVRRNLELHGGQKKERFRDEKPALQGAGDTWTWTAIEADTKLIISHFVGGRDGECAKWFIDDMAARVSPIAFNSRQMATKPIWRPLKARSALTLITRMLNKIYGASPDSAKGRYSPAECIGDRKDRIEGDPDMEHVSARPMRSAPI